MTSMKKKFLRTCVPKKRKHFKSASAFSSSKQPTTTIPSALIREIIVTTLASTKKTRNARAKRMSDNAAKAASEVIRNFIVEARHRAAIEAECEEEAKHCADLDQLLLENNTNSEKKKRAENDTVAIRADHITRIAAELLWEFS